MLIALILHLSVIIIYDNDMYRIYINSESYFPRSTVRLNASVVVI